MAASSSSSTPFSSEDTGEIVFPEFTGPAWSSEIPEVWKFDDVLDLERYLHEVRKVFDWTIERYHYNSVPSFVLFYKQFKQSGIDSLREFYDNSFKTEFSSKFLSCVGLSFAFKEALSKALTRTRYLKSCEQMYFASSCLFPNDTIPSVLHTGEPLCPPELTEHVTLALKFSIASRRGHVIMDFGYGLDIPVIVMEDGLPPQTQEFQRLSRAGSRFHTLRSLTSDYILWIVKEPYQVLNRVIYLKLAFQRLDLPEKRHKVNPLQATVVYKGDIPAAGYFTTVGSPLGHISAFIHEGGNFRTAKVLYKDVFVEGEMKNEVLKKCMDNLEADAMQELRELVLLCQDKPFTNQLVEMDRGFRAELNRLWTE